MENEISQKIIGVAIEVHKVLGGPGLLESVYESCLCHELRLRGLKVQRQLVVPVMYKGAEVKDPLQIDILVDGLVIVEVKAVDMLHPLHEVQLLTYLRLIFFFRDVIHTALMPKTALANSLNRQPTAFNGAILGERLMGVLAAGGIKAAAVAEEWADAKLIGSDRKKDDRFHTILKISWNRKSEISMKIRKIIASSRRLEC